MTGGGGVEKGRWARESLKFKEHTVKNLQRDTFKAERFSLVVVVLCLTEPGFFELNSINVHTFMIDPLITFIGL